MPVLRIQTTHFSTDARTSEVARKASKLVAELTGKSERQVMVLVEPPAAMTFGGSTEAAVYAELKSIGLESTACAELSRRLCAFFQEELGVPPERVYIEFASPEGALWGWNGETF
jgi:phenylpyruvate tautomerase